LSLQGCNEITTSLNAENCAQQIVDESHSL